MDRPSILLISIDALRPDRLGCYGNTSKLTPHIDRLAGKSVRFDQAITGGSWTQAAFPVIMTSTYASMFGGCLGPLASERPSPVETLAAHGYETAGFSASPLLSQDYGYQRGFGNFFDLVPGETDPKLRRKKGGQILLRTPMFHYVSRILGMQTRPAKLYVSAEDLTDQVCLWINNVREPFFAWAHYMDVHWPYYIEENLSQPTAIAQAWKDLANLHNANWNNTIITPAQRKHYIELYEKALAYTDIHFGRLISHLNQIDLTDNTIVIVLSDHGEEFLEHGRWGHFESNLYDEILKVPLIIYMPDFSGCFAVTRQVGLLDLMPTILDLCECPAPEGMEGNTLVPLWSSQEHPYTSDVSISEMFREDWHRIAVRTEAYKYIWDSRKPENPELFDLRVDADETQNISDQSLDIVKNLHGYVDRVLQKKLQTWPQEVDSNLELSPEVLDRLRGLGYVE